MKKFITIMILLAAVAVFGMKAYAQETKQEPAKQEAKEEKHEHSMGPEKKVVLTPDADGVQRVEVTGGEYFFDPNYIVVKMNVPVEMKFKKTPGYVPHDVVVNAPEAGIQFTTDLDKEGKVVKFTPTKAGKYEMSCDKKLLWFKSHKERGMHGIIEVVE